MKNLLFVASAIFCAFEARANVVSKQEFTAEINAASLHCVDGHPGPYPTKLMISLPTYYGSSTLTFPSTLLLQNTDSVLYEGKATDKCADHADVLKNPNAMKISGTKLIRESSNLRPDQICQREVREELSIRVGGLELKGQEVFVIFPAPADDCKK